jgi:hypothetical protein
VQTNLGRTVALKMLRQGALDDPGSGSASGSEPQDLRAGVRRPGSMAHDRVPGGLADRLTGTVDRRLAGQAKHVADGEGHAQGAAVALCQIRRGNCS